MIYATFVEEQMSEAERKAEEKRLQEANDSLKPCPFCGARLVIWKDEYMAGGLAFGCSTPECILGPYRSMKDETPESLAKALNRRAVD